MKYRTIVADPPWFYDDGFPQGPTGNAGRLTVAMPYSSMSVREVAALPVEKMADRDAWLFLWTTNRYLASAFTVMDAWGFKYTQTITWRKTGCPSPFIRSVAPQHSEYLLAGRRGKPKRLGAFPSSVVDAPAQAIHSAKPELFTDYLEAIGEAPRVELFARRNRLGWDTWGNEALCHVEIPA
jgi:site-specific DNA-methyltransferase (adenine-specific)